ncbi:MAG: AraC family ligand binding domain-containing protein, partial [Clostridia bacterium]|nr:AraC family ligand binding domain-containing protein [Clostridia bacterium]
MKNEESIFFSDPSFLFEAYPNRVSSVIALEEAQKALHEELEIKYFYEGSATLLIGTQTVEVKAGDVVVINPYEFHTTLDGGGETPGKYHLFMIGLDIFADAGADVPDLRHLLLGGQISFQTHFPSDPKLGTLLQILVLESTLRRSYYRLTVRGLLMQIFAHLLREGVRDEESPVPHKDVIRHYRIIEPALRAIRDEYARAFT